MNGTVTITWLFGQTFERHTIILWRVQVFTFPREDSTLKNKQQVVVEQKDEEPVVCSRTASKLIVEIEKVIGYN